MPRKVTFTEEKIVEAAMAIVREEGVQAVTARSIAKRLGASPKPLFTSFRNMDEVMAATIREAKRIFIEYMKASFTGRISFRRMGLRWMKFVYEEPEVYRMLFMPEEPGKEPYTLDNVISNFDEITDTVLAVIYRDFGLSEENARKLYNQMILHAHGISCLLVAEEACFTEEQIIENYTEVVMGLVMYYKSQGE